MITLAQLRKKNLLSKQERLHLRNVDYETVQCINSIGDKVSICAFHRQERLDMFKELEERVYKEPNSIYEKSGKTIAYTLATLITFRVRLGRKEIILTTLPHHINFEKKDDKKTYLIYDPRTGYHKIGRSNNPMYREKTLQSEQPDLMLICTCEIDIEKQLHKAYRYLRIRGEWFNLSEADVENIEEHFRNADKEPKKT